MFLTSIGGGQASVRLSFSEAGKGKAMQGKVGKDKKHAKRTISYLPQNKSSSKQIFLKTKGRRDFSRRPQLLSRRKY